MPSQAWTNAYVCDTCGVELEITFYDLMSGCMEEEIYNWYDEDEGDLLTYTKMRDGTIKIEEKE